MRFIITILVLLNLYSPAFSADYKSKEFNDPNSHLPVMFICAFIGKGTGLGPDGMDLVVNTLLTTNPAPKPEQFNLWVSDAEKWISIEGQTVDFERYWKVNCEAPFNNMRNYLSSIK